MCKSVKGAAFFGSTVHVVAAFSFFVWFLFDTVISEMGINLWKCVPPETDPGKQINTLVHYLNLLFKFLYYICLCTTGIYIFRGVERASPRMIKFALLVFAIIQVISLGLFIAVSFTYYEESTSPADAPLPFKHGVASQLTGESITYDTNPGSNESTSNSNNLDLGASIALNESLQEFQDDSGIIPVLESPLSSYATPTTPMSIKIDEDLQEIITTTSTVATTTTSTTTSTVSPVLQEPLPPIYIHPPQKMSHNQLASLVFQILLVGFNAVGTIIYTTVLIFHLMTL